VHKFEGFLPMRRVENRRESRIDKLLILAQGLGGAQVIPGMAAGRMGVIDRRRLSAADRQRQRPDCAIIACWLSLIALLMVSAGCSFTQLA
jgi:hypothetical protein